MILGNEQIRQLVNNDQLISDFDEQCLRHCSYRLRIGKLIRPGGTILFDSNIAEQVKLNLFQKGMRYLRDKIFPEDALQRRLGFDMVNYQYELKPNELVIFQTREQIKMPMSLSASYSALDSIAKEGLLLINASMVEPGYEGPLSGVLLNFSSYTFQIKPGLEIAKINFYEVKGDVTQKLTESVGTEYSKVLQEKAKRYTQTFLDVERLKNDVIKQSVRKVKGGFLFGGVVLAILLAFSTIEPVLYNWIWHDTWVPLSLSQQEFERSLKLEKQNSTIDSLSKRIDSLQSEIHRQYEKSANIKP